VTKTTPETRVEQCRVVAFGSSRPRSVRMKRLRPAGRGHNERRGITDHRKRQATRADAKAGSLRPGLRSRSSPRVRAGGPCSESCCSSGAQGEAAVRGDPNLLSLGRKTSTHAALHFLVEQEISRLGCELSSLSSSGSPCARLSGSCFRRSACIFRSAPTHPLRAESGRVAHGRPARICTRASIRGRLWLGSPEKASSNKVGGAGWVV